MAYLKPSLTIRDRVFEWGKRTYIMGIVNVSPESFSGDGVSDLDEAVGQARRFAAEGADIIDVGGQSTRPGFDELSMETELERVLPVISAIVAAVDLPVSIDSYRAAVAAKALEAGAHMVNDITGLRHDFEMPRLIAGWGVPAVVMHNQRGREFTDVIGDISEGFKESMALAEDAGIEMSNLMLDPGFGFGWTVEQNLEMLRRLHQLQQFGLPLLVGTSRKSTIGAVLDDAPEDQRAWGTAASVAIAIAHGADIVRVHDVAEMAQVARLADAIVRGQT